MKFRKQFSTTFKTSFCGHKWVYWNFNKFLWKICRLGSEITWVKSSLRRRRRTTCFGDKIIPHRSARNGQMQLLFLNNYSIIIQVKAEEKNRAEMESALSQSRIDFSARDEVQSAQQYRQPHPWPVLNAFMPKVNEVEKLNAQVERKDMQIQFRFKHERHKFINS